MILTELAALSLAEIERMWHEKQGWSIEYYAGGEYGIEFSKGFVLRNPGGAIYTFECASESEAWAHCPSVTWDEAMKALDELPEDVSIELFPGTSGSLMYCLRMSDRAIDINGSPSESLERAVLIASVWLSQQEQIV